MDPTIVVCNPKKRVFRVLQALPYFAAACHFPHLQGAVPFDPSLEESGLLRNWLNARLPALHTKNLSREEMVRLTVEDMLLNGCSLPFGLFYKWHPMEVSAAFSERWLQWWGIYVRGQSREQLVPLVAAQFCKQLRPSQEGAVDFPGLIAAATRLRMAKGRLMEAFEFLDSTVLAGLQKADFEWILRALVKKKEIEAETSKCWNAARAFNALVTGVDTSPNTLYDYVSLQQDQSVKVLGRVVGDGWEQPEVNWNFSAHHAASRSPPKADLVAVSHEHILFELLHNKAFQFGECESLYNFIRKRYNSNIKPRGLW